MKTIRRYFIMKWNINISWKIKYQIWPLYTARYSFIKNKLFFSPFSNCMFKVHYAHRTGSQRSCDERQIIISDSLESVVPYEGLLRKFKHKKQIWWVCEKIFFSCFDMCGLLAFQWVPGCLWGLQFYHAFAITGCYVSQWLFVVKLVSGAYE